MIIPGFLISIATFPSVIVHEAAHLLFCKWRNVPVVDVRFFRFGNPAGYVIHAEPADFTSSFLISVGPFIINSLLCIVICLPIYAPMRLFGLTDPLLYGSAVHVLPRINIFGQTGPLSYAVLWLGISIGMHAFPSTQDASNLWQAAKAAARGGDLLAIVSFPLVIVIYLANFGSIFWFDYLYGLALGFWLPSLLLN